MLNTSGKFVLEVSSTTGEDIVRYKLELSDISRSGRNIIFSSLPKSRKSDFTGRIGNVRLVDKAGGIVIENIPFSSDNSQPFRFRALDVVEGENVRWTDGEILLHKISVQIKNRLIWTWV